MSKKGGTSTHTRFTKGSKIRIIFRDRSVLIARFVDKRSKKLMQVRTLEGEDRIIRTNDLSSCNYYKPLPHERET